MIDIQLPDAVFFHNEHGKGRLGLTREAAHSLRAKLDSELRTTKTVDRSRGMLECPHCQHELTDAEVKALWAARNGSLRKSYTGGVVWKKHNPNTSRCRCARCTKRRSAK
jgi:hypothetical protein